MSVTAIIIDDSAVARRYINFHLVRLGCVVVGEAADAADGLKLFRATKPDIVTLDLVMPKHDDIDAMTALRAIKKEEPYTVVIVVSTLGSLTNIEDYRKEGIFEYIVKPISQFSFDYLKRNLPKRFPELRFSQPPKND
jgi:two-component system chemotaxis response regulator CheY